MKNGVCMNKRELLVAKKLIITYLSLEVKNYDTDKLIHEISGGNEELLKKYIEAVKEICYRALEQLDEDKDLIELL